MPELSNNEAGRGFTHVYTATYEDLQTIGNGGQLTIATIPAGGAVEMAGVYESVAFAGTTSLVIDVGTSTGDPDEFIDADPEYVSMESLQAESVTELENQGGGQRGFVSLIAGLCCNSPKAHGFFN